MKLGLIHKEPHVAVPSFSAFDPTASIVDWGRSVASWGLYLNNTYGTCTIASVANAISQWMIYAGTPFSFMTDSEVLANLSLAGGNPETGATVDGFMSAWATQGYSCGGQTHQILGYANLDVKNHSEIEKAISLSGGIFASWNLPLLAQSQYTWGLGGTGDAGEGTWGGHETWVNSVRAGGVEGPTWGALKVATWDFWDTYITRAVVVITKDWNLTETALDDIAERMARIRASS